MKKKTICVVMTARGNYAKLRSVIREIKKRESLDLKIIVGGSLTLEKYGKILEDEIVDDFNIDHTVHFLVEGENPYTMAKSAGLAVTDFANAFQNFSPDIVVLELPKIIENFPTIELDNLSLPGWEAVFKNFIPRMKFLGNKPAININASRGCPYSCSYYCVYPLAQGKKLRYRSPKKIVEEMMFFYKKLDVSNFIFRDPVFCINRKHTVELCEKIIDLKSNFRICIETHLKNIDFELAKLLKKAGVKLIYTGIESSDEEVKQNAHRVSETDLNQIEKVKFLENIGIKVKAMYIIGLPADTKETYKKTLNFAKKINSSYVQFNVFTPYPGTPAFNEYKDKITSKVYEDFNQCQLAFEHKFISPKDALDLLNISYRKYYLSFQWMFSFLKRRLIFS